LERYAKRNTNFDIIADFDLYEEQIPSGRWLCRDHPHPDKKEPLIEYEDRKKLWIQHSFAPLAAWTRKSFTRTAVLCLYRSGGSTWAEMEQKQKLKKTMKSSYLFKKFPVLTVRQGKESGDNHPCFKLGEFRKVFSNNDLIPAGLIIHRPEHSGRDHHQQNFARRWLRGQSAGNISDAHASFLYRKPNC